ncbi:MAG: glycosyltransferase family 4 protein [Acidimicrobiales bacterium]
MHILAWRDLADIEAGGSELHAAEVARRWAAAGIDVTMRTSYAQGSPPTAIRDGYRVIRRRGRYMIFPAAVIAELRGLHGPRDALVEIWNGVPFLSPMWARGPRICLIHHVHRNMWRLVLEERLARLGETLELRVLPPIYRRTPIVTLSESSRRELIEQMHFRPERVHVVPPGIDPRFSPGGEKSPTPLVVSVGRLMPSKGFDTLIRTCAVVREQVPDLELVIVGDGYERDNLEHLISGLDATGWVHLVGRRSDDELIELYRRAWAVASASIAEGWGMTLTEAAACGTPAVATRIAGHLDSVAENQSGLLADSERDFAAKLTNLLTDHDLRARLSEGARKHADRFTWDATALGVFTPLAEEAIRRRARRLGRPR